MHKIGIIGLGHVGTTVAHILLLKGLADELVMIDQNAKKVEAEYYDFADSFARTEHSAVLKCNDYGELADADIVITSFGDIEATAKTGDRFAELPINKKSAVEVGRKIKESGFNGILLNISNPCDAIVNELQKATGMPHNRIFGTGTFLDTARLQRAVGAHFSEAPQNVSGFVLGEHGNSQFAAWSQVRVLGQQITDLAAVSGQLDLEDLAEATKAGGYTVFHGKYYTNFGIAAAALRLVTAILNDANIELPVSNFREEYGTYCGYPAVIGQQGVVKPLQLNLTAEEERQLAASANYIKDRFDEVAQQLEAE